MAGSPRRRRLSAVAQVPLDAGWTPGCDPPSVIVTIVLRLVGERLEAGELVGQAQLVSRGEEATVHDASELIAFARRGAEFPAPAPPADS